MSDLRWIKKETDKGKYVLQFSNGIEWVDVPCEEEVKPLSFRDELAYKMKELSLDLQPDWTSKEVSISNWDKIANLAVDEFLKMAERFNYNWETILKELRQ